MARLTSLFLAVLVLVSLGEARAPVVHPHEGAECFERPGQPPPGPPPPAFSPVEGGRSTPEWVPLGPEGGYVRTLAVDPTDPDVVYVAAYSYPSRIFKTTDGGGTWQLAGQVNGYVVSLTVDSSAPSTVYAGSSSYVHKSTDGGASWTSQYLGSSGYPYDLAVDPTNSNIVWAGGYHWSGSRYCIAALNSTDAGGSWSWTDLYPDSTGYGYAVAIDPVDPDTVYVGGYYMAAKAYVPAVFRTTDGGTSWDEANAGLGSYYVYDLAVDPTMHTTLYAGKLYGVYKSTDCGDNWAGIGGGTYNYSVCLDPSSPGTIYASQYYDVRKTTNDGGSWSIVSSGLLGQYFWPMGIDPVTPSRLYLGGYVGFFKSTNSGTDWSLSNAGLLGKQIKDIVVSSSSPGALYAAAAYDAVYKSVDWGASWTRHGNFVDCDEVQVMVLDELDVDRVYALTGG
jgi:photosystem II stability/assembly factor-like uncharacterized protein